jgi:hypothetical protein
MHLRCRSDMAAAATISNSNNSNHNNNNSNSNSNDSNDCMHRITTDLQGAQGCMEWNIEHANFLDHKPTDNRKTSPLIWSPIFIACGHRWRFKLRPAYKESKGSKDKDDTDNDNDNSNEDKENEQIRCGIFLYLGPDEPKDVIAMTQMTIVAGNNHSHNGRLTRYVYAAKGNHGWGETPLRSKLMKAPSSSSTPSRIIIRTNITLIHQDQHHHHRRGHDPNGMTTNQSEAKQQTLSDYHKLLTDRTNRYSKRLYVRVETQLASSFFGMFVS